MKKLQFLTVIVAVAALLASCAKPVDYSVDEQLNVIFEAYVQEHAAGAVKMDEGIYMEKLRESPKVGGITPRDSNWVKINYTMRNMSPVLSTEFATRYAPIAERLGIDKPYTYYAPEYMKYGDDGEMLLGIYYALGHMKEGEIYRVYIPSYLAFDQDGSEDTYPPAYGYGVENFQVSPNSHIIVDLELAEVVPDPEVAEIEQVRRYATQAMGLSLSDTLTENVYMRTLFYSSTETEDVGRETTILYRYMGSFLDGFIFDTNIADSAINRGQYIPGRAYTLSATTTTGIAGISIETLEPVAVIAGLDSALCHMKYGEVAEVVMPSSYAYGEEGNYPTGDDGGAVMGTIIPPYTPLRFVVQAGPKYGNGTRAFPYHVQGLQRDGAQNDVWFWGYVVGAVHGSDMSGAVFGRYVRDRWNIILGESGNTAMADFAVPVELPAGQMREDLNLASNVKRYTMRVLVRGDVTNYLGTLGITNVTEYYITETYDVTVDPDRVYPPDQWID